MINVKNISDGLVSVFTATFRSDFAIHFSPASLSIQLSRGVILKTTKIYERHTAEHRLNINQKVTSKKGTKYVIEK
jgi:hypothetical protein